MTTTAYTDIALLAPTKILSRKVIVNVDDLGLSEPVNEAVVELAQRRLITATSYMIGGNIDTASIKAIHAANVDVGLHLDFTGVFDTSLPRSLPKIMTVSYLNKIDANTLSDEIKYQFDAFEDTFDHAPRFIDGHQHVHQFPTIRQCLLNELLERYGNRLEHSVAARVTTPLTYDLKSWIIYSLGGSQLKSLCQQANINTNTHFGGVYDFKADHQKLTSLWEHWLSHCPIGTGGFDAKTIDVPVAVIMCHPAVPSDGWQDGIKEAREREYRWITSGTLKELYDKHSIELTHWRDLYHKKRPKI